MKKKIIDEVTQSKIIAILRGVDANAADWVCPLLIKAGIKIIEFPIDRKKDNFLSEHSKLISSAVKNFSGEAYIGCGSVLNELEAKTMINSGAMLIVSPNVSKDTIKTCVDLGTVCIPGALTPSECVNAYSFGADFIKLFPAGELGVSYFKALKVPLGHIPFLAVGGINLINLKSYYDAGASGFGLGSDLVSKDMLDNLDEVGLYNRAVDYVSLIKDFV